jgi:F-type H+-transporting ATPase subunit gamma
MATLKDIKLRIDSIKNTQQITKAMKMVAASKMRKAEEAIVQARPYSEKLRGIVSNLSSGAENSAHPLLEQRDGGKAVVLLITSDKGLCGGLNNNLCKNLVKFVPEHTADFHVLELVTFGKKGGEFFGSRDFDISDSFKNLKEKPMAEKLDGKVQELIRQYENREFDRLYIAYNRFKNVITQIPIIKQVLPVEAAEAEETADEKIEFIFEPSTVDILSEILPQYVKNQAYTALLDNYACEHAARMTAMDAATTNAAEMIDKLQLQYNRARQAAITSELIEIISGAEAL